VEERILNNTESRPYQGRNRVSKKRSFSRQRTTRNSTIVVIVALRFGGKKAGTDTVAVQNVVLQKSNTAEQFKLERKRARGIFHVNVVKHFLPISGSSERFQISSESDPHQFLHRRRIEDDKVGDVQPPAGLEPAMELGKHALA